MSKDQERRTPSARARAYNCREERRIEKLIAEKGIPALTEELLGRLGDPREVKSYRIVVTRERTESQVIHLTAAGDDEAELVALDLATDLDLWELTGSWCDQQPYVSSCEEIVAATEAVSAGNSNGPQN